MHVIATAGHVDHGKSTLVRALTGMEPDRWEAERKRGLSLDLGFAWTTLASGRKLAFVDVPGHERFVTTMLAGAGPVPMVLFVVAADEGWKPQSTEHLHALHAFGVRRGLLVLTRCDLANPSTVEHHVRSTLQGTTLADLRGIRVSATTGAGIGELRAALDELLDTAPAPDPHAPVRLWLDRVFTIRGAGTVVTGTLGAGTVTTGQTLHLGPPEQPVEIRGLQSLDETIQRASGVSRIAINLRGIDRSRLHRGDALVTAAAWTWTDQIDVRLDPLVERIPAEVMLHIGSASVPAHVRPLGGPFARIRLRRPLPLHIADRAVLRDPSAHIILAGLDVADVLPPRLRRRGAAAARAAELSAHPAVPAPVLHDGLIHAATLRRTGAGSGNLRPVGRDWLADPARWETLRQRVPETVEQWIREHPLDAGMPAESARRALNIPDPALLDALITDPVSRRGDRLIHSGLSLGLTPAVRAALDQLRSDLADHPFRAPEADRLQELGLGPRELAALVRAGALYPAGAGIYLLPDARDAAARIASALPQPFTVSQARRAWDTTRRVAVPLLESLDAAGLTRRRPDGTRTVQ